MTTFAKRFVRSSMALRVLPYFGVALLALSPPHAVLAQAASVAGAWDISGKLTVCAYLCGSPVGSIFTSTATFSQNAAGTLSGSYFGFPVTGTVTGSSVNFIYTYDTFAGPGQGVCSGAATGIVMTLTCSEFITGILNGTREDTLTLQGGGALPNLAVTSVAFSPSVASPGDTITVSDTTANIGAGSAGGSTTHYYLDLSPGHTPTPLPLSGSRGVPPLAASLSSTASATVTIPTATPAGDYYVVACANDPNAFQETDVTNNCAPSSTTIHITDLPDFFVTKVRVAQVVFGREANDDANGDLVVGKPGVARVTVDWNRAPNRVPSAGTVVVTRLTASGLAPQDVVHTFQELDSTNTSNIVDFYFTPTHEGPLTITAEVNPAGSNGQRSFAESDETNNGWPSATYPDAGPPTVRQTAPLQLEFIKLDCDGPIADSGFHDLVSEAFYFATSVFPVDPQASVLHHDDNSNATVPGLCFAPPTKGPAESVAAYEGRLSSYQKQVLWATWLVGRAGSSAKRTVAVTSRTWMDAINSDHPFGFTFCNYPSSIVVEGGWETVAHELGHTYGLSDLTEAALNDPDARCVRSIPPGPTGAEGYWVQQHDDQFNASLMGTTPDGHFPHNATWPTRGDYEVLYAQFSANPHDPELLLVSGEIFKDGHVTLNPLYRAQNGFPDAAIPGEFSVRLLDRQGTAVGVLPFTATFRAVDPAADTDSSPFAFAIPYAAGAATLEIVKNGVSLTSVGISGTLLLDAVRSIPENAFAGRNSKTTLVNKVIAYDKQLAADAFGAREKLEHDIRAHVQEWLRDDYVAPSLLTYTKARLLDLIDSMIARLAN
jgi:hypothetical protein